MRCSDDVSVSDMFIAPRNTANDSHIPQPLPPKCIDSDEWGERTVDDHAKNQDPILPLLLNWAVNTSYMMIKHHNM